MKRDGATRTFLCSLCEQSGHVLNSQSAGKLAQKQAKKKYIYFFFLLALFHKLLRSDIIEAID
jgi:hypothetical protein